LDLSLGVIIQVVKDQLSSWADKARAKLAGMGPAGTRAAGAVSASADRAAASVKQLGDEAKTASSALGGMDGKLRAAVATLATAFTVKGILETHDAMRSLAARMKIATGSAEGAAQAMAAVSAIAQETGQPLQSVGELYARLARTTKVLGVSQAEVSEVTGILAKALAASGESGASAEAALIQLGQAFSFGTLRGENLNSVLEQASGVAALIADGLGVTTGKLREMAEAGELTSERVFRAIQRGGKYIDDAFGQLPDTVGRSLNRVGNSWAEFLADLDKSVGYTDRTAAALDVVADNMGAFAVAAAAAGAVFNSSWAFKMVPAIKAVGIELAAGGTAAQVATSSVKAFGQAALTAAATTARFAGGVGVLIGLFSAVTSTAEMFARYTEQVYAAEIAAADARDSWRAMADEANAAAGELAEYANVRRKSAEQIAVLSAEERDNYRQTLQSAIAYQYENLRAAIAQEALGLKTAAAQERARKEIKALKGEVALLNTDLGLTAKQIERLQSLPEAVRDMVAEFRRLRADSNSTADALGKLVAKFSPENFLGIRELGLALNELRTDAAASAEQVGAAWDQALAKLTPEQLVAFGNTAKQVFLDSERDARALADVNDAILRRSLKDLGIDAAVAFGGMSQGAKDAIASLDNLATRFLRLNDISGTAKKTLIDAVGKAIDTADTARAVEELEDRLWAMKEAGLLAGKEVAQLTDKLKEQSAKITPGIQSAKEAYEALGITSQAALQKTADGAREAYEALVRLGVPLADQKAAFLAYAEAAIAANGGVASAVLKAKAATLGLSGELSRLSGSTTQAAAALEDLRAIQERGVRTAERNTDAVREHGTAMVAAAQQALENAKAQGDALAIAEATVAVRKAEADAAQDLAVALANEASVAWNNVAAMREKAAADGEVTAAEREAIEAARDRARELSAQATAAKQAAQAADSAVTAAVGQREKIAAAAIDWGALAAQYGIAAGEASKFADAQAEIYANLLKNTLGSLSMGVEDWIGASRQATEQAARFVTALRLVEATAKGGDEALTDYIQNLRVAIAAGRGLGEETMAPLREALRDAQDRMRSLGESARDTLNSLKDEMDELNKNYDAIEKRRAEAKRAELQAQIAIATSAGNAAAVSDLTRALALLNEISAVRIKEAAARERDEARKLTPTAAPGSAGATAVADRVVTKVVDINLKVGTDKATVQAVEGSEEVLVEMLRKSQLVARP
jgi:tape measure domain-containing protein